MAPSHASTFREGVAKRWTGVRAGRAMEPRNQHDRGADVVHETEGHIAGDVMRESPGDPARSENQGMCGVFMRENRESPSSARPVDRWAGRSGNAIGGKPGMNGDGQSDGPVVPANLPNKAAAA